VQEAEQLRRALRRLRQTCVGQGSCEQGLLQGAPPSAHPSACGLGAARAARQSMLSLVRALSTP